MLCMFGLTEAVESFNEARNTARPLNIRVKVTGETEVYLYVTEPGGKPSSSIFNAELVNIHLLSDAREVTNELVEALVKEFMDYCSNFNCSASKVMMGRS